MRERERGGAQQDKTFCSVEGSNSPIWSPNVEVVLKRPPEIGVHGRCHEFRSDWSHFVIFFHTWYLGVSLWFYLFRPFFLKGKLFSFINIQFPTFILLFHFIHIWNIIFNNLYNFSLILISLYIQFTVTKHINVVIISSSSKNLSFLPTHFYSWTGIQ